MKCPHCGEGINVGWLMGSIKSEAKAKAVRENGKLGGRPVGKAKPTSFREYLEPLRKFTAAEEAELERNRVEMERRMKAYR